MNLAEMKQQFDAIRQDVLAALETVQTLKEVEQIRVQQLGKKGPITEVLKNIKNIVPEERPQVGALANELRSVIEEKITSIKADLEAKALVESLRKETIDVQGATQTATVAFTAQGLSKYSRDKCRNRSNCSSSYY